MAIRDSFVYVVEDYRFQVVNVARPREPVLVGSCLSGTGQYFEVVLRETLAYVAGGPNLEIISVADPSDPYVVDTGARFSMGLAVRDTFAYIPWAYDTLFVYSVADPADLRLLSSVPVGGVLLSDAALGNSKVYVSSVNGIDIYGLDDPSLPVHRGSLTSPEPVLRLTYSGGLLYAAMQEAGIAIYETTAVGVSEGWQVLRPAGARLGVAPNPVRDRIRVIGATADARVVIFDGVGRVVHAKPTQQKGGAIELNTVGLRSGVYFVEVKEKSATTVLRIVKP